jgi:hypothetical protein
MAGSQTDASAQNSGQQRQFQQLQQHYERQLQRSLQQIAQQANQRPSGNTAPLQTPFQVQRAGPNGPITLSIPGSQPITFDIPSESAPLIDPAKLEAQLPEAVGGLPRVRTGEDPSPSAGFRRSTARAEYMDRYASGSAEISLSDAGGMLEMVEPLINEALAQDVDEQSETGYVRTQQFQGYKGTVTFDKVQQLGRITVLVNRVFVEVTGNRVPVPELEKAVEQLDIPKLASLQP